MTTDAILLEQVGNANLAEGQTLVRLAPIPTGRSYVIWAKGSVFGNDFIARFVLEAFGTRDSADITFSSGQGQASFSLVVAVTLPPDDDLFAVATVTGETLDGFAVATGVKLLVLAVDSVSVTQGSS
jgi:hypothetical protein